MQADDVVTAPVAVEPAAVEAVLAARRLAVSQVGTPARVRLVELQVDPVYVSHSQLQVRPLVQGHDHKLLFVLHFFVEIDDTDFS